MDWTDLLSQNLSTTAPQNVAQTDLLRAQATGADISNQRAQLGLDLAREYVNGKPGAGADQSGVGSPTAETPLDLNVAGARQHVFQNYAPLPNVWTPQDEMARRRAALSGIPGAVEQVTQEHDARITSANNARSKAAQQQYNDLYGVATAPAGQAMDMLELVEPEEAARLRAQGVTDDEVRQHAASLAGITHSVSQLPMEYRADGVAVDKTTGQEIPGYDDAVGLSAKDRAEARQKLVDYYGATVTEGDNLPTPRYQLQGAGSAEEAADAQLRRLAARGSQGILNRPASPAAAAPAAAPAGQPSAAPSPQPVVRRPAPVRPTTPAPTAEPPTINGQPNPYADPEFKYQRPILPKPTNQEELEANKAAMTENAKNYATNANDLKKSGDEVTNSSAQALQRFQYAKQLLAQPDSRWVAGIPGDVTAVLSKLGINLPTTATRAEVVKALTQGALQGLKSTYGAKPAMFDVKVNLEQAFPDPKSMSVTALNATIDDNIRNLQYDIGSGQRVARYLRSGNDPSQFNTWNEKHFQRAANINPGSGTPPAPPEIKSQKEYDALPAGAAYTVNGQPHHKGGK